MECKFCGRPTKDVQRKGRTRCNSCNTKVRRVRNKMVAIQFLGGKCQDCGVKATKNNHAIFCFHHRNPEQKDFQIGRAANKSWSVLKKELQKCDLLCLGCHSLEHSTREDFLIVQEAVSYKGTNREIQSLIDDFMGP